jgi:tetratricopeptide (TPR) repeat protein
MKFIRPEKWGWCSMLAGLIALSVFRASAESNLVPRAAETPAETESLRAYLALQEQVRSTQLALEKNREETEAIAARSATALADQIKMLTQTLSEQRTREVEAMQSTNRLMLIVVGVFASLGFIAMLLTSWLQMKALNRLTEFSSVLPMRTSLAGLLPGGSLISNAAAAQANTQLFGALDRIERRMHELEQAGASSGSKPAVPESARPVADPVGVTPAPEARTANGVHDANGTAAHPDQLSLLLAKGQSLLSLEHAGDALECFDAILNLNPNHAEALVKKGAALELLRRDDEALRCYDRAIEADGSLTIAYLQKGGLFNRLERYEEALTCYERALQTQDRTKA